MKKVNKQNSGFINIEISIVLVLITLVFYVVSSISDYVTTYSEMKTKLDKTNSDLIMTKSVIVNQKQQIKNLTDDLAVTQRNYEELINKKQKVIEKVTIVKDKKTTKEKQVIDGDVQLKTSGTLSEESLAKLSEIRSLALVEHYSSLFNDGVPEPSI